MGSDAKAATKDESLLTVIVAFAANLLIAIAKTVVAVITASASMMAEAAHSWADTGNEVFLYVAARRAVRPRDPRHPAGYGRDAYVWSLFAAFGLFAVGEALYVASKRWREPEEIIPIKGSLWMSKQDWKRSWAPWLRGTALGFPIGALPAGGAEIPTFLSYTTERKLSKHPEEFGHGAIEGVAGPEAANNASAAGSLVPLLTLGLPTSATAAVMLAGFQQYNIQPGPLLFATNPTLVWSLIEGPRGGGERAGIRG